jgi:putative copper export protein
VVPAIAGVVFTGGGHVYTIENLFHFLHQLAAIWLGGILLLGGSVLVLQDDISFSEFWIVWGSLSLALGR